MSDQLNPVAINPGAIAGKTVTAISSGSNHTCAVASGQAYCWGSNNNGQLGVGNSLQFGLNPMPVNASGVLENKTINSISAGVDYTCVRASGQAYCWGDNSSGQLGDATTSNRSAPVSVNTSGALAGKTVSDVSAGLGRTCAVASGQAYCWGAGYDGLIQSTPVAMSPLPQL